MRKLFFLVAALSFSIFISCKNEPGETNETGNKNTVKQENGKMDENMASKWETVGEKNGIRVSYFPESPDFPEAKLTQLNPKNNEVISADSNMPIFKFKIENFELSKQTPGMAAEHCANSVQGQHIHSIINGEPYSAHYTDTFTKAIKDGNNLSLAFLSRSYHESIKHKGAYQLTQFTRGRGTKVKAFDLNAEMLFYSRPKGEYTGKDTKIILLDFYLVNTDLSETGNKVRATINGNEFILTRWVPYAIMGLQMGENTIKLELLDKDGKLIPGPYNSAERKITLKP
jgi:hypothetical protein